jgi:hypothetical protein
VVLLGVKVARRAEIPSAKRQRDFSTSKEQRGVAVHHGRAAQFLAMQR